MPNICSGEMMVRGSSKNVEEFINIIKADYNYTTMEFTAPRHFFRVFEAIVDQDRKPDTQREVIIIFDCAWSVYSCMMEGPFTYFNDFLERENNRGTSLIKESERLCLSIEVFSQEIGMAFEEHYIIHNGKVYVDKEYDLQIYDYDYYDDINDFKSKTGITDITQEQFDYDGFYASSDLKWEYSIGHDNLKNMLLKPMIKKIQ